MRRKSLGIGVLLAIVLLAFWGAPAPAALVIDNFAVGGGDTPNQFLMVGPGGPPSPPNLVTQVPFSAAGALGGIRNIVVTRTFASGFVTGDVSFSVTNAFSLGAGAALGTSRIIYGGSQNTNTGMVIINPGLGGVNLSQNGINTGISTSGLSAEGGVTLTVNLYSDNTHESTGKATLAIGQPLSDGSNLAPIFIAFANFLATGSSGGATLTNINAIEVILDNGTDQTMHLNSSGTIGPISATGPAPLVPAPPSVVLLLTGLGIGALYRLRARWTGAVAAVPG
jgi:hypothetical protein